MAVKMKVLLVMVAMLTTMVVVSTPAQAALLSEEDAYACYAACMSGVNYSDGWANFCYTACY